VQQGPGTGELPRRLGDAPYRIPQARGIFITRLARIAHPPFTHSLRFAEKANDSPHRLVAPRPPVAVALAGEEVPAAHGAHRHRPEMLGVVSDVDQV